MEQHPSRARHPHRDRRHVQREIEQAMKDYGQNTDARTDLQQREAAPTLQRATVRTIRTAYAPHSKRHDHRCHETQLHERLQIVAVCGIDVATEISLPGIAGTHR
jgi:hypothetical protein